MKLSVLCAALALGLIVGCQTEREAHESETAPAMGTRMSDLPIAAQKSIRAYAPGAKIDDIDKEARSGRTIYEVTFVDPGKNLKMHVDEDGNVVRSISEKAGAPTIGMKFKELPPAVQKSIQKYAPNRGIIGIESEIAQSGRMVYEVQFEEPGEDPKMHFAEDGTLLMKN